MPVALWLLVNSLPENRVQGGSGFDRILLFFLIGLSGAGLGFATWAWSPWIAAVAALVGFSAVLVLWGGLSKLWNWMPVWIFCWVLVPLPFGLDEDLIVRLRIVTTRMTSSVLDQIGILHQSYASVIHLPQKPLFIADACSGIHSLYVLMAAALFLCAFLRRNVLHSILLLCSTFGIVLIENVGRIVCVAAALGWNRDLSVGAKHTALGVIMFCLSGILILSMDQLLMFLLPEQPFKILSQVPWPWRKRKVPLPLTVPVTSEATPRISMLAALPLAIIFPVLGLWQVIRMPYAVPSLASMFPAELKIPELGKDAMPAEVLGYQLQNFEMIQRVEGDPFGKSSQRWVYKKGRVEVGISLDYPYDGVKDLCECYSLVGWQIPEQTILDADVLAKKYALLNVSGAMSRGLLNREFFGNAILLFSSFDLQGNSQALIKDVARGDVEQRGWKRLATFGTGENVAGEDKADLPAETPQKVFVQIHLLGKGFDSLTPEVEQELVDLFEQSRKLLIPKVVSAVGGKAVVVPQDGELKDGRDVQ